MTVKSSISLTDQQDAFARALVRKGRYASMSAVMQQALVELRDRMEVEAAEKEALAALLEQRRRGKFVDLDTFEREVEDLIARKRREYGLDG